MNKPIYFVFIFLFVLQLYSQTITISEPTNFDQQLDDAITEIRTKGKGGTVYIKSGTYILNTTKTIPSNVTIKGDGFSTRLLRKSGDYVMFNTDEGAHYVNFQDLTLGENYPIDSEWLSSKYQIEGISSFNLRIFRVNFNVAAGSSAGGVRVWDGNNPEIQCDGQMTHIESSYFNHGCIWVTTSDSKILNNFIWASGGWWKDNVIGNASEFNAAITIKGTGNVLVQGNDIVPSKINGGLHIHNSYNIRVIGNFFDGNPNSYVATNWGIIADYSQNLIINSNTFWQLSAGGICLEDTRYIVVSSNNFKDNNCSDKSMFDNSPIPGSYLTNKNHIPYSDIYVRNTKYHGVGINITNNIHEVSDRTNVDKNQTEGSNEEVIRPRIHGMRAVHIASGDYTKFVQVTNNIAHNSNWDLSPMTYGYPSSAFFFETQTYALSGLRNNIISGNSQAQASGKTLVKAPLSHAYIPIAETLPFTPKENEISITLSPAAGSMNAPSFSIQDLSVHGFNIVFANQLPADLYVNWSWDRK